MKKITLQEVLNGSIFTRRWVRQQYGVIALVVGLIFLYVYFGFESERQYKRLNDLQDELQDAHYELITIESELTSLTRQSAVADQLRERGSQLKENRKPAVLIEK